MSYLEDNGINGIDVNSSVSDLLDDEVRSGRLKETSLVACDSLMRAVQDSAVTPLPKHQDLRLWPTAARARKKRMSLAQLQRNHKRPD